MATVIVPAHNEASVIRRCLDSIIHQEGVDQLIVACNGCSDETAAIVKADYPQALCLDIDIPSKVNALNEAEKHIQSWPVFYIDADTQLSENSISVITQAMQQDQNLLLAAPEPIIDTSASSWLVKQYYKVWLSLPYIQDGVVATCSYVISEKGHQRFKAFPAVINDDGFVRCQFTNEERGNVAGSKIFISAPRTLYSLIKIKSRARLGNMELAAKQLCSRPESKPYSKVLSNKLFSKDFIPASIYLVIATIIRLRAKKQFQNLNNYRWEVDQTSR